MTPSLTARVDDLRARLFTVLASERPWSAAAQAEWDEVCTTLLDLEHDLAAEHDRRFLSEMGIS
jgi:hypothetical protein